MNRFAVLITIAIFLFAACNDKEWSAPSIFHQKTKGFDVTFSPGDTLQLYIEASDSDGLLKQIEVKPLEGKYYYEEAVLFETFEEPANFYNAFYDYVVKEEVPFGENITFSINVVDNENRSTYTEVAF